MQRAAVIVIAMVLSACGLKDDLYLPEPAGSATASAPDPTRAEDQASSEAAPQEDDQTKAP